MLCYVSLDHRFHAFFVQLSNQCRVIAHLKLPQISFSKSSTADSPTSSFGTFTSARRMGTSARRMGMKIEALSCGKDGVMRGRRGRAGKTEVMRGRRASSSPGVEIFLGFVIDGRGTRYQGEAQHGRSKTQRSGGHCGGRWAWARRGNVSALRTRGGYRRCRGFGQRAC